MKFHVLVRFWDSSCLEQSLSSLLIYITYLNLQDVRLTQCEVWPKYGFSSHDPFNNSDQRMHCDFPNHTLVCPPPWDNPEAVEIIIYLSDVEECGGATAVVPREGAADPAYKYPMTR